jgi:hypothetical protein
MSLCQNGVLHSVILLNVVAPFSLPFEAFAGFQKKRKERRFGAKTEGLKN